MAKIITRKNLLGRDVKITKTPTTKTREVTGDFVAKKKVKTNLKGTTQIRNPFTGTKRFEKVDIGKRVSTSKIKVNRKNDSIDVTNKTKYTGSAGRTKNWDDNPKTNRKKTTVRTYMEDPNNVSRIKKNVPLEEKAAKAYKGKNLPRRY
jgi:hypothetical protein